MDTVAVAAARGLAASKIRARDVALVGGLFGGFQAFMPLIGWAIGNQLGPLVATWGPWLAFALLGGIGGKMLWEARGTGADAEEGAKSAAGEPFGLRVMLLLAVATSIDSFVVGITLPMLDAPLVLSLLTIGITTAVLSSGALLAGRHFGGIFGPRLNAFGGLVLIGLGVKALVEHLA
ncbi:manganese efflux pump MntP family protein [Vulgatibacter incomptus]|uniref:Putative manganese efflux pump MntP n=1 Tax=Vulgatibacter incomptus TaxID=1391653 RepID=A0A0K1PBN7_9BACT|nr:manganese efflux pump MntP family protein [Vulgatibacter incomptus]AKU90912.1 membrane protein [Vulgatibacter incomptus]